MNYAVGLYLTYPQYDSGRNLIISETEYNADFTNEDKQPELKISKLAYNYWETNIYTNELTFTQLDNHYIIEQFLESDIMSSHPGFDRVLKMCMLELSALQHCMANNTADIEYMSTSDMDRIKSNLEIMCDYLASYDKYQKFVPRLREFEVSIGYLRNQLYFISTATNYR